MNCQTKNRGVSLCALSMKKRNTGAKRGYAGFVIDNIQPRYLLGFLLQLVWRRKTPLKCKEKKEGERNYDIKLT